MRTACVSHHGAASLVSSLCICIAARLALAARRSVALFMRLERRRRISTYLHRAIFRARWPRTSFASLPSYLRSQASRKCDEKARAVIILHSARTSRACAGDVCLGMRDVTAADARTPRNVVMRHAYGVRAYQRRVPSARARPLLKPRSRGTVSAAFSALR